MHKVSDRLTRIKTFAMNLDQAVHDEHHFRSHDGRVVHFWDTDSIFFTAFGFRALKANQMSTKETLAQALLSAGLLGKVSILSHHRVELFANLEDRVERISADQLSDKSELAKFLDTFPTVQDSLEDVAPAIRQAMSSNPSIAGLRSAFEALRTIEPEAFILLEAASGTLAQRYRKILLDSGVLDYSAATLPGTKQILADPRYPMFEEGVERSRRDRRFFRISQNAADAAALTALAILIDRASFEDPPVLPRFFTSAPSLQHLYRTEAWVRQELSYPIRSERNRRGTIWRTADYYILKAMFPALASDVPTPEHAIVPSVPTYEELSWLSRQLIRSILLGDETLEKFVDSYLLSDGAVLSDVIDDFSSAGMATIWLRLDRDVLKDRWSDGVAAISQLSGHELARAAIDDVLNETTDHLRTEIVGARNYAAVVRAFSDLEQLMSQSSDSELIQKLDDLGTIRWGVSTDRITHLLDISGISSRRPSGSSSLLRPEVVLRDLTIEHAETLSSILIGLDSFSAACSVASGFAPVSQTACLQIISLGARVRERRLVPDLELRSIMQEVQSLYSSLSQVEASRLCLGFAYTALHAWRRSMDALQSIASPQDSRGWARWSIDIVRSHIDDVSDSQFIYALNHLVYAQTIANIESHDRHLLAARLRDFADSTGLYRLADTVGYHQFLLALRDPLWERNPAQWFLVHRDDLEEAQRWLDRARRGALSDREVIQHEDYLRSVVRDAQLGTSKV